LYHLFLYRFIKLIELRSCQVWIVAVTFLCVLSLGVANSMWQILTL
jgi:hypothetical protein